MTDLSTDVRRLLSAGHGDRHIAGILGITRHRARVLIEEARRHTNGAMVVVGDVEPQTAAEFAERIAGCWRKGVDAIIETGTWITRAKAALPHGEFGQMIKAELPFGEDTAQRLMVVAADSRITNPAHARYLPPHWTTLFELTKLDDEQFEQAITNGAIRPDLERKALINGARSLMGSRIDPADSLDFYCTPPWATRALCEIVLPHVLFPHEFHGGELSAWEPAAGEGHMSEVLSEYFGEVLATDIHDYGRGPEWPGQADFLDMNWRAADWIITNPPFGDRTIPFILRAIEFAGVGVAMFLRLQILEGQERFEKIFKPHPPTLIAVFAERVPLCKGRWDPDAGTATAYIWLVWMKDRAPMAPFWIPPGQREALTKKDDRARFAAWSMPDNAEAAE